MAIEIFRQLADYNRWANLRIYGAALAIPDERYRRPTGVFFGSLHGTLNHLLLTDRVWLKPLTGSGEHPTRLDAIIHDDRRDLLRSRIAEDARLIDLVGSYEEADLDRVFAYRNMSGKPHSQKLQDILLHLFNHQTHHRGTPMPAVRSSPAPNHPRSTCWHFSAARPHRNWSRDRRPQWVAET